MKKFYVDFGAVPTVKFYTVEGEHEAPKNWTEVTEEEWHKMIKEIESLGTMPNTD